MSNVEFNGVAFEGIITEDGNPTAIAADLLGAVHSGLADAVKAFNKSKRDMMSGNVTPPAFATAARAFADITEAARGVLRDIPRNATARGGATPQTVWCAYFEGVDAALERNMTRADAKAANKRSFG